MEEKLEECKPSNFNVNDNLTDVKNTWRQKSKLGWSGAM